MVLLLALLFAPWDSIDVHCIVRDAAGRAVTSLRADQLQVFDVGELRPATITRDTDAPAVVRLENRASLYPYAYQAIMRAFPDSDVRRVLVISGPHSDSIGDDRRWELAFLALRQHVMIYAIAPADATVTALADVTGGRVAPDMRAIQADLDAQYHVVAVPSAHTPGSGVFHALEVRAPNGYRVQAPRDYYVTPEWQKD